MHLLLPKVTLEWQGNLEYPIKKLGVTAAFDENLAEFPGLRESEADDLNSTDSIYLSAFLHLAKVNDSLVK